MQYSAPIKIAIDPLCWTCTGVAQITTLGTGWAWSALQDSLQVTTHHGPRGRHLTLPRVATCQATVANNMNLINSENIHLIMSARRITARDVTLAGPGHGPPPTPPCS